MSGVEVAVGPDRCEWGKKVVPDRGSNPVDAVVHRTIGRWVRRGRKGCRRLMSRHG